MVVGGFGKENGMGLWVVMGFEDGNSKMGVGSGI